MLSAVETLTDHDEEIPWVRTVAPLNWTTVQSISGQNQSAIRRVLSRGGGAMKFAERRIFIPVGEVDLDEVYKWVSLPGNLSSGYDMAGRFSFKILPLRTERRFDGLLIYFKHRGDGIRCRLTFDYTELV